MTYSNYQTKYYQDENVKNHRKLQAKNYYHNVVKKNPNYYENQYSKIKEYRKYLKDLKKNDDDYNLYCLRFIFKEPKGYYNKQNLKIKHRNIKIKNNTDKLI